MKEQIFGGKPVSIRPVLIALGFLALSCNPFWLTWFELPFPEQFEWPLYGLSGFFVVLILAVKMRWLPIPRFLVNLAVSGTTLLICFYLLIGLDRFVLAPEHPGYLFPPHFAVRYETPEFDITASINSLGIRDREYPQERTPGKKRILVFGDSFTFGWGVSLQDTWVKRWEQHLNKNGGNVEVLNFGQSGRWTRNFAQEAERVIPELKPDAVVIALYQANDLYQAMDFAQPNKEQQLEGVGPPSWVLKLRKLFPNLLLAMQSASVDEPALVRTSWQPEAQDLLQNYSTEMQQEYQQVDPQVQRWFEDGKINPGVVDGSVRQAHRYLEMQAFDSDRVQAGLKQMEEDLQAVKDIAARYQCEVRLISIPHRVYVSKADGGLERELLNMDVPENLIANNSAKKVIAHLGQKLELKYYYNNDYFRKKAAQKQLYYRIDGHFTPEGSQVFADWLSGVWKQ